MVEKLTENKQVNLFAGFIKYCGFAADILAKIENIWRKFAQYFNVIVGSIAAASALSLAARVGTAKTAISVWLFPLHCTVAPIVIIGAIIYLVCEANSKLTTIEALNQSRDAFTKANDEHKTRIQKINDKHKEEMAATQSAMSDVLGKFTEHAQEIYTQLTQQKADFQKMSSAQEALQELLREHVGGNLGKTLDQMNEVVEALGDIAHLPENLKTVCIKLKEAQTQYDALNKRHEALLDRFEKGLKKADQ